MWRSCSPKALDGLWIGGLGAVELLNLRGDIVHVSLSLGLFVVSKVPALVPFFGLFCRIGV